MINKLFSLLMSGTNSLDMSWYAYRRYTPMLSHSDRIPTYTDPYKRSVWANYIIELAKCSPMYREILKYDPTNTYADTKEAPDPHVSTSNCSITAMNMISPIVSIDVTVEDGMAYINNGGNVSVAPISDNKFNTVGITVTVPTGTTQCSVNIVNPTIGAVLPDDRIVKSLLVTIPDSIRKYIDIEKPHDKALVYCLGILIGAE